MNATPRTVFESVVRDVSQTGRSTLAERLIENARHNAPLASQTIKDVALPKGPKATRGIVVSAGPSLHKRNSVRQILDSGFDGTIVAIDASYAACLREGLIPDFVLTLDPHPTRMVRWFGDRDYLKNSENDSYFQRQDLDVEFRRNAEQRNQETIDLINCHGSSTRICVSSTSPENVIARIREVGCDTYWWNPLVDDPSSPDSLSRQLHRINGLPCMNTGGNVGTAAWVFASAFLKLPKIGVVGMDMGYYPDTPYDKTQLYYEYAKHLDGDLDRLEQCFLHLVNPLDGVTYYTDPTYYWYTKAFLQLLSKSRSKTFNCTEGGTLVDSSIPCIPLRQFLNAEV